MKKLLFVTLALCFLLQAHSSISQEEQPVEQQAQPKEEEKIVKPSLVFVIRVFEPSENLNGPQPLSHWLSEAHTGVLLPRFTDSTLLVKDFNFNSLLTKIFSKEIDESLILNKIAKLVLSSSKDDSESQKGGLALSPLLKTFPKPPKLSEKEIEFRNEVLDILNIASETPTPTAPVPLDQQILKGIQGGYQLVIIEDKIKLDSSYDPKVSDFQKKILTLSKLKELNRPENLFAILELVPQTDGKFKGALFLRGTGLKTGWIVKASYSLKNIGASLVHLLDPRALPDTLRRNVLEGILKD